MAACPEFKHIVLLDAHGELEAQERTVWEKHRASCAECRREHERLVALIRTAGESLAAPCLSNDEQRRMSEALRRRLRSAVPESRTRRVGWVLAPALAACMVLVVAGWFGLKNPDPRTTAVTAPPDSQEHISRTDKELLENMELLQEMDSLEQLVRLLDEHNRETSRLERGSNEDPYRTHV